MRAYLTISGIFFALIAVAHVLRGAMQVPVQVADMQIPVWVSWPAALVTGALAVWAFRLGARKD